MKLLKDYSIKGINIIPALLMAIALIISAPAQSQNNELEEETTEFRFADEDLLAFFDINQEISVLQRETQQSILETIEAYDLTMERFNQIAQAAQIGALQGGIYSDEEIAAFNEAAPMVTAIQREMQTDLIGLINDKGLTAETYQEILSDYRNDQELQAHVRELLRERARQQIREQRDQEAAEQPEEN